MPARAGHSRDDCASRSHRLRFSWLYPVNHDKKPQEFRCYFAERRLSIENPGHCTGTRRRYSKSTITQHLPPAAPSLWKQANLRLWNRRMHRLANCERSSRVARSAAHSGGNSEGFVDNGGWPQVLWTKIEAYFL